MIGGAFAGYELLRAPYADGVSGSVGAGPSRGARVIVVGLGLELGY